MKSSSGYWCTKQTETLGTSTKIKPTDMFTVFCILILIGALVTASLPDIKRRR